MTEARKYDDVMLNSVADAVRLADNYLERPNCPSLTGKMMEAMVQQPIKAPPSEEWTKRDVAIRITSSLAAIDYPRGPWYRYVYGKGHVHPCRLPTLLRIRSGAVLEVARQLPRRAPSAADDGAGS